MAATATKLALLLGLLAAALAVAAAQPSDDTNSAGTVTIRNPALLVMDISNDDKDVRVTTDTATLAIAHAEQPLLISVAGGDPVATTVRDGDMLVVVPDPDDAANPQAIKVLNGAGEPRPPMTTEVPRNPPSPKPAGRR